ncbi:hypothetical protein JXO52_12190 [bacterium]|nr:hypothetical protein [bacterium]
MRRRTVFSLFIPILLILVSVAGAQPKKRVAVFTFEDKSQQGYHWWSGGSPGDGMSDMLITELVKSGKYTVVERGEIDQIMQEQNLGMSGRVTPESAAQVGKLLGVQLAIMGAVTEFGVSKGGTGGRIQGIGLGVQKQEASVGIDVRFVNTTTGEILLAESVHKKESKSGLSVSTAEFDFHNQNDFDNSLAGKATRAAIEEIMQLIDKQMDSAVWEGMVLLIRDGVIYMKPGEDAGVKIGDVFTVYTQGEELIDPETGISLGSEESKVGTIKVTGMVSGGKAAKASPVTGSGFAKGDIIRLK